MLRRILAFIAFILLIGAVSSLVYYNSQDTSFRLTPEHQFTLPLGVLMLAAALGGGLLMFLIAIMREGRHALREWRVHRELRAAERTAEYQSSARSLALGGDFRRARALLTKVTQKREPDISDVIDYAETFSLEGDTGQARRALEEGLKDFGNDPLLLYALARAYRADGDLPAAVSTLERALAVYPSSKPILTLLRDLLFELGSWQRACEIQERIVALRPGDAREENRLAGARYEAAKRREGDARAVALKSVTGEHPDFVPALLARARVLAAAGEQRRAMKLLERAAKRRPRSAILDELERLTPEDRYPKLAKLYGKLVSGQPGNGRLRLRAARFLVDSGRIDDAEALLRAVSANGDLPAAHALWAQIHDARAEPDQARQSYRQALGDGKPGSLLACEICHAPCRAWQERCPSCGAWGTLETL